MGVELPLRFHLDLTMIKIDEHKTLSIGMKAYLLQPIHSGCQKKKNRA